MSSNEQAHLRIEMLSQPRYLAGVRATIDAVAERLGFDRKTSAQIALAVDEAICNVIRHGYECRLNGRIWISVWPLEGDPAGMRIVIEDEARQVDPTQIRSRSLDDIRPGGLGVHIIHKIMDRVDFSQRDSGGMRLELEKRIGVKSTVDAEEVDEANRAMESRDEGYSRDAGTASTSRRSTPDSNGDSP